MKMNQKLYNEMHKYFRHVFKSGVYHCATYTFDEPSQNRYTAQMLANAYNTKGCEAFVNGDTLVIIQRGV